MRLDVTVGLVVALAASLFAGGCTGDDDGLPLASSPGPSSPAAEATLSPTPTATPPAATVAATVATLTPSVTLTQPAPASTPVTPAGGSATTAATATPSPLPATRLELTLADNRTTVTVPLGSEVLLRLGDAYAWDVTVDNTATLALLTGPSLPTGAQAFYRAAAPGTAVIRAAGDPVCRRSTPACGMPSIAVEITVVVR